MNDIDPKYNDKTLRALFITYTRKSAVMKEICDHRHARSIGRASARDRLTVTASVLFLGLSFFGSTQLALIAGITETSANIILSVATFLLLASSIWQISADRTTSFQNYRGIQDFAAILNRIEYVTRGGKLDDTAATYWAREITSTYNSASNDIPRVTKKDYDAAKKRLR